MKRIAGFFARILLPLAILAGGGFAYSKLSLEREEAKTAPAASQHIRTKVTPLQVGEFPVIVHTHGIVQSHNQVILSSEVSGRIVAIHPTFEAGAYFSQGDVLVELDDRDYQTALAVATSRHKGAKSSHRHAESNHQRLAKLLSRGAATDAEFDQAGAELIQTEAELESATSQIEQAQRDLERTKIRAPFDGRVQEKLVGLGQLVNPGTSLGDVFAVDYAEIRLPLAGRELQFLKLPEMAEDVPLQVELRDAIDPNSETVWTGEIVRTEGRLDQDSLELFAIARIEDPFGLMSRKPVLRIGQPVAATIVGEVLHNVVAIPRGAVRQLDQVFLVDEPELTLKSLTIQPVWSDEEHIIVRDPSIANGTLLATTKLVYAPDGAKVEIIPSRESAPVHVLEKTLVTDR